MILLSIALGIRVRTGKKVGNVYRYRGVGL